jgi:predicted transcriptional regulator of viral defense system
MEQNHGGTDDEYRREANAFINKIVISHKSGEDYHSLAKSNPFTNDAFVCGVAALLESEYERVDYKSQSILVAMKSTSVERGKKLCPWTRVEVMNDN